MALYVTSECADSALYTIAQCIGVIKLRLGLFYIHNLSWLLRHILVCKRCAVLKVFTYVRTYGDGAVHHVSCLCL